MMDYEWDRIKPNTNLKKHGIAFDEAKTVFNDPLAMIFDDELHSSQAEYREIIIGHSQQNRLLIVSFTERLQAVRIISARLTTQQERRDYENYAF
jgi:uncharacterized protein